MSSEPTLQAQKQQYLEHLLAQSQPKRILLVTCQQTHPLQNYLVENPQVEFVLMQGIVNYEHYAINERFDLVVVCDQLEKQTKKQGQHLIAYLRNRVANQVLLLLNKAEAKELSWKDNEFFALGMQKHKLSDHCLSYSYDLDKYNHKRTWNTPQFWANPEQFHQKATL